MEQREEEKIKASSIFDKMRVNQCDEETANQRDVLVKKRKIAQDKRDEAKRKIQILFEGSIVLYIIIRLIGNS